MRKVIKKLFVTRWRDRRQACSWNNDVVHTKDRTERQDREIRVSTCLTRTLPGKSGAFFMSSSRSHPRVSIFRYYWRRQQLRIERCMISMRHRYDRRRMLMRGYVLKPPRTIRSFRERWRFQTRRCTVSYRQGADGTTSSLTVWRRLGLRSRRKINTCYARLSMG